jgi:hypothetical protein
MRGSFMVTLKSCFSVSGDSVEIAVMRLYDEPEARTVSVSNPGFDDVMGEPYLEDTDDNGIGERVRPEDEVLIKCKAKFTTDEEQRQDQIGNAPASLVVLTVDQRILQSQAGQLGMNSRQSRGTTSVSFGEKRIIDVKRNSR